MNLLVLDNRVCVKCLKLLFQSLKRSNRFSRPVWTEGVNLLYRQTFSLLTECVCVQAGRRGPAACCSTTSRWARRTSSSSAWRRQTTRRWRRCGWLQCTRYDEQTPVLSLHKHLLLTSSWIHVFFMFIRQAAKLLYEARDQWRTERPGSTHPSVLYPDSLWGPFGFFINASSDSA